MKTSFKLLLLLPLFSSAQFNNFTEKWKLDADFKNASLGFTVIDANTSKIISEYNSHVSLIPASTLKIITTSAALSILGPNYQFETKIAYSGNFNKEKGILNGDIHIIGSGDPTFQSEFFFNDKLTITDKIAAAIKEKGIKEINGKIIGDAYVFERKIPDSWIWSDISNYFGSTPCGLSFMDNKYKIYFATENINSEAKVISVYPDYLYSHLNIQCNVIAKGNSDEACIYGDPLSFNKIVSGTIPPNKKSFDIEGALPDPALLCAEMLFKSLKKIGVNCSENNINSNYIKPDSVLKLNTLYTHHSPNLSDIIYHTNIKSNNLYCESILMALGNGSALTGIKLVKEYWKKNGLNTEELYLVDGSGLSRENTLTTNFQANLLVKIYFDKNYKILLKSLPIAGKEGSMSQIGNETFIENNMQAKTGYINRVRAYCGFLKSKSGKNLAFSLIINNYNCSAKSAKNKLEKFLIELGNL